MTSIAKLKVGVNDLVTISEIDESAMINVIKDGKRKVKEVVEELTILDDYEASQLEQTKEAIQTMRMFLNDMESKFLILTYHVTTSNK